MAQTLIPFTNFRIITRGLNLWVYVLFFRLIISSKFKMFVASSVSVIWIHFSIYNHEEKIKDKKIMFQRKSPFLLKLVTFTNHRWRCCLIHIFWHLSSLFAMTKRFLFQQLVHFDKALLKFVKKHPDSDQLGYYIYYYQFINLYQWSCNATFESN